MDETRENQIAKTFFTRRMRWKIEDAEAVGQSCLQELSLRMPQVEKGSWPARVALGGAFFDGKRITLESNITKGGVLEYFDPIFNVSQAEDFFPKFSNEQILFADPDLAIVFKPAGLPSTAPRDFTSFNLQTYLSNHFQRPVHLPSRLDVAVSGIMLVSLTDRMNRYAQKAQGRKWFEKYYVGEVEGELDWLEKRVEFALEKDYSHPLLHKIAEVGGVSAITELVNLDLPSTTNDKAISALQARPITGRTHQIRVHCASIGNPIVGDPYYGLAGPELHLCSYVFRFFHPYCAELMTFKVPAAFQPAWLRNLIVRSGDHELVRFENSGVSL